MLAATRPQTVDNAKELADVWRGLHRQDVFPIHPPTLIAALANPRDHLVPDHALRRLAAEHLLLDRWRRRRPRCTSSRSTS